MARCVVLSSEKKSTSHGEALRAFHQKGFDQSCVRLRNERRVGLSKLQHAEMRWKNNNMWVIMGIGCLPQLFKLCSPWCLYIN